MTRVLIIDDSELIVQMLTMVCQGEGFEVVSCLGFAEVEEAVRGSSPDVIVTDLNLPAIPGGDIVAALRTISQISDRPIVLISGQPQDTLDRIAAERGAQGALSKDAGLPVIASLLPALIHGLLPTR
ncbi:MAG: response regulator [Bradymonadaceae bacterium]